MKDKNVMKLKLYMKISSTEVLGPGKRFAVWVQGCSRHCKGCIAPDTWNIEDGVESSVDELANEIISTPNIEGITISGGEPFLQQEPLCELIRIVHNQKDLGVIIYTGYSHKEIANTKLASMADIIIDGEYIQEQNDDMSLRGSSNQSVICITDRYSSIIGEYYGKQGRKIEVQMEDGKPKMIGIPSKTIAKMIGE